jgi:hypothetical protein
MSKKPTGFNAITHVTGIGAEVQPIVLPNDKEAIEADIVRIFSKNINDPFFKFTNAQQNKPDDFDFTIQTDHGPCYLELAEFAPLSGARGGYESAPNEYGVGDMADKILSVISKKAEHYAGYKKRDLVLLVYITHFAFLPSESVITVVRHELLKMQLPFERVYFFLSIDGETGVVWKLRPSPIEVLGANMTALRLNKITNFDPRNAISENGGIRFQVNPAGK